jgi:hypothetical protein
MNVEDSRFIPITTTATLAFPFSGAAHSQDRIERAATAPGEGTQEDRVPVLPAERRWPRVFPGL